LAVQFDHRGLLPEGVHPCDEKRFSQLLVDPFPADPTRGLIRDGFFELRSRAKSHGVAGVQWVDGSYTTTKRAPRDVDVVTFSRADQLGALSDDAKDFVREVLASGQVSQAYRTHSYVVAAYEPAHPAFPAFDAWRRYWREFFGRTRSLPNPQGGELPGVGKGILSMGLGDRDKQPNVSTEV
jgi:hypothetical protein